MFAYCLIHLACRIIGNSLSSSCKHVIKQSDGQQYISHKNMSLFSRFFFFGLFRALLFSIAHSIFFVRSLPSTYLIKIQFCATLLCECCRQQYVTQRLWSKCDCNNSNKNNGTYSTRTAPLEQRA